MNDRTIHQILADEVHQAAATLAARWPTVGYEELSQAGWELALTQVLGWCPTKGRLGPYIGRALRTSLRNHCYRMRLPVHYPKNKEYQHAKDGAWATPDADEVVAHRVEHNTGETSMAQRQTREAVRRCIMALTKKCPEVRPVLLGTRNARQQARRLGVPEGQIRANVREVQAALRAHPDLQEIR